MLRRRRASNAAKGGHVGQEREGLTPEDAIQAMMMAVKDMIRSFKQYEKQFLVPGLREPRRRRSSRAGGGDKEDPFGYSSGGLGEDEHADYLYAMNRYRDCNLKQRVLWIRYKSKVGGLMDSIQHIQVRRIGTHSSYCVVRPLIVGSNRMYRISNLLYW